jgi:energy-coupling factor transport system substrate-specific component
MVLSFFGFIPLLLLLMVVITPIIGGTPFMLFLTKVRKFGMIKIFAVIIGVLMMLTGMGFYAIFTSLIFGLAADFIAKSGNYSSVSKSMMATSVYSCWVWGNFLPIFIGRDAYIAQYTERGMQEYADTMMKLTPMWVCPVMLIAAFIAGIIGALIGKALLKKHFEKAGIA